MKQIIFLIILIFTCGILSQLFAVEPVVNTFPYQESFEGPTFPPAGWTAPSGNVFSLGSVEQTNPSVPGAADGNNWVNLAANHTAYLTSPRVDFPAGSEFYRVTYSGYAYFTHDATWLRVLMGTDNSGYYTAQELETLNLAVDGEWNGNRWSESTINLGFLGGSSKYFYYGGVASGTEQASLNFDNFRITAGPPLLYITPSNNATDVQIDTQFSWYLYNLSYTSSVYISTDSLNYSLLYHGTNAQFVPAEPLANETTYYWYVNFEDNLGHSVNSQVYKFRTRGLLLTNEIVDFPYLADFEVEDLTWNNLSYIAGKKAAGGLDTETLENIFTVSQKSPNRAGMHLGLRCPDGEANYAMKMAGDIDYNNSYNIILSPVFRLIAGNTYEIKYNYRVSQPMPPSDEVFILRYNGFDTGNRGLCGGFHTMVTNTDYALSRYVFTPSVSDNYIFMYFFETTVDVYIDNFRITMNGDDKVTSSGDANGGVVDLNPSPIYDTTTGLELDTDLHITNITGDPTVNATLYWTTPDPLLNNSGLSLVLNVSSGSLSGAVITFTHNLGFTPGSISYRFIPNGFTTIFNPNDGTWTNTQCTFTVPAVKANGDFEVVFNNRAEVELPVELSSFTAAVTSSYYVSLQWITQSETNHMGFNVLRSAMNNLSSATKLNTSLISNGVSAGTQTTYNFAYQDEAMDSPYYFWLESVSQSGSTEYFGPLMASAGSNPDTPSVIPAFTCLLNAYPNPFKESTSLRYDLKDAQDVRIDIYNVKGQLIRSYIDNNKAAGSYTANWDGTDANGKAVASGIYFYRMVTKDYTDMKKMMLVR